MKVDEWIMRIQDLFPGEYVMNCTHCQVTCHSGKCRHMVGFCSAFSWSWRSASCRHCPYNCSFTMHEKQDFKYVMESVKVTKTSSQLKQRYEEAEGKKLSAKTADREVQVRKLPQNAILGVNSHQSKAEAKAKKMKEAK